MYHRFHQTGGMSVSAHCVFQNSANFFGVILQLRILEYVSNNFDVLGYTARQKHAFMNRNILGAALEAETISSV
jgi:hypothetical protein